MVMKPSELTENAPGKLLQIQHDVYAYIPDKLPLGLSLPPRIVKKLSSADNKLGTLAGITGREFNPYLIGSPMLHREAILSSRMEGTLTTPRQLVLFEVLEREDPLASEDKDAQEVVNYTKAMRYGLELLEELPVCLRLIRKIHGVLMAGVRGNKEKPGEFRSTQNYIGDRSRRDIRFARFVPPPVQEMKKSLDSLEAYLNRKEDSCDDSILIRLALVHYQFETIHPFRDGNGRIGRLLLPLLLCSNGRLKEPVLYLSAFFERNRDEYVDLLLSVSKSGDWITWIDFFLDAVLESAEEAISFAESLLDLRQQYHRRVQKGRSSALLVRLIDRLFQLPAITIKQAADVLEITHPAAAGNIRKLEKAGILTESSGKARNMVFIAEEILSFMYEKQENIEGV